jgi:hypothetical protein
MVPVQHSKFVAPKFSTVAPNRQKQHQMTLNKTEKNAPQVLDFEEKPLKSTAWRLSIAPMMD